MALSGRALSRMQQGFLPATIPSVAAAAAGGRGVRGGGGAAAGGRGVRGGGDGVVCAAAAAALVDEAAVNLAQNESEEQFQFYELLR